MGKDKVVQTRRSGTVNYFSTVKPRQKTRNTELKRCEAQSIQDHSGGKEAGRLSRQTPRALELNEIEGPREEVGAGISGLRKRSAGGLGEPLPRRSLPHRRTLLGSGPRPPLPLPRRLRGAALRARPGRLHRPHLRQRRHLPGGRRRAPLLLRAGLRRPRLSGARRPVCRAPLRPRRPLLRALLRPRLRLRAGLHGRAVRVPSSPRRRGRIARGPARPETGGPTALPFAAGFRTAGGRGLGRRCALAGPRATPWPKPGYWASLVGGDPGAVGPRAP